MAVYEAIVGIGDGERKVVVPEAKELMEGDGGRERGRIERGVSVPGWAVGFNGGARPYLLEVLFLSPRPSTHRRHSFFAILSKHFSILSKQALVLLYYYYYKPYSTHFLTPDLSPVYNLFF